MTVSLPLDASRRRRRLVSMYLGLQGLLGLIWWAAMVASPRVRSWFELDTERTIALDAFAVADVVVFIGGSLVSAWALWRGTRWAGRSVAFTAGGVVYATLYLLVWAVVEHTGFPASRRWSSPPS